MEEAGGGGAAAAAAGPRVPPAAQEAPRRLRPALVASLLALVCAGLLVWARFEGAGATVLVLAGGGAKGAWQVGVLRGLCEREEYRNSWQVISGTSIGALNAGLLAQFPPQRQCSDALVALESYWRRIGSTTDVWQATHVPGRWDRWSSKDCLDKTNLIAAGYGFVNYGGLCDPSPGSENYHEAVNASKIRHSGTKLRVTASSLTTGTAKVFTEADPDILDACMASGSIAPIVYPKRIRGDLYVDGGIFHNTPLLSILDGGVKRAIVVLLGALEEAPALLPVAEDMEEEAGSKERDSISGFKILQYYLQAVTSNLFDTRELRDACMFYPKVQIEAVIPHASIGSVIDFDPEKIESMIEAGHDFIRSKQGPVDVCALVGVRRSLLVGGKASELLDSIMGHGTGFLQAWHPRTGGSGSLWSLTVGLLGFYMGRRTGPRRHSH